MIGVSLRTIEAIRDLRFPQVRRGEERNPTVYCNGIRANRNLANSGSRS